MEAECRFAGRALKRLERREAIAHRAGECAHEPYGVTVQLLLIRHALPLRSEPGQGSDPDLSDEGVQQAERLPEALKRFPITRLVSSPQRRSIQTAQPVADALGLTIDVDDLLGLLVDLTVKHEPDRKDPAKKYERVDDLLPIGGDFDLNGEPPF
jgi:probable phosphoglycerate mutase